MKLTQAIAKLLLATKADGRSPATLQDYDTKLRALCAFLGDVDITTITADDLRRFIVHLQEQTTVWADNPHITEKRRKLSPFSIAGYIRVFKRLFNWLEAEGILDTNPARRIRTMTPKRKTPHAIETEDLLALLETTRGETPANLRDRAIILMLADTGCRVGGLCGLTMADVDLDTGTAIVLEKGQEARAVFFTDITARALREWCAVRPDNAGDWFFASVGHKAQGQLSVNAVNHMLKRRAQDAGVEGRVNPHAFRHAFAREFLLSGGDLGTLSDILGHSNVEVTKSFYAIFTMDELRGKHRKHSPITNLLGGENDDDLN